MKVSEGLSRPVVTVDTSCPLAEAARLMQSDDVGELLVVHDGHLEGIVTDRDLVIRGLASGAKPSAPVKEFMSHPVTTVPGSADVTEAFRILRAARFRRLPVLDGEELTGILTVDDLLVGLVMEMAAVLSPVALEVMAPTG